MPADLSALQAYAAAAQNAARAAEGPQQTDSAGAAEFSAMLSSAVSNTGNSLAQAEQLTAGAAVGQAELVDLVTTHRRVRHDGVAIFLLPPLQQLPLVQLLDLARLPVCAPMHIVC